MYIYICTYIYIYIYIYPQYYPYYRLLMGGGTPSMSPVRETADMSHRPELAKRRSSGSAWTLFLLKLGVPFWGPYNKDCSIGGSIFGILYFGENRFPREVPTALPHSSCRLVCCSTRLPRFPRALLSMMRAIAFRRPP